MEEVDSCGVLFLSTCLNNKFKLVTFRTQEKESEQAKERMEEVMKVSAEHAEAEASVSSDLGS